MKKFVVERNLPGAGNLTSEELQVISQTSCEAINQLDKPYHWIQSFITDDKIYCIHIAESEAVIREHARLGKFPINTVSEVKVIIDPLNANSK
jgi:Nickel responsive protein SCO4226-like